MSNWLFRSFRFTALAVMLAAFLFRVELLQCTEEIPAPCDQLNQQTWQALCARFLADSENTGGQTFSTAVTVDDFDTLKEKLNHGENYGGVIFLLADDLYVDEKLDTFLAPRGIVAIIGNPEDPPRIHFAGLKGELEAILLVPTAEEGAPVKPQGFYSWYIEWVMSDLLRDMLYIRPHYGTVHITHSIFRCILPIIGGLQGVYIHAEQEHSVDRDIATTIFLAHNQFYNRPAYNLDKHERGPDIMINCANEKQDGNKYSDCEKLGDLVIRNNSWHSSGGSGAPDRPSLTARPSPFDPRHYRSAIALLNIVRATISDNHAVDPDAVLSFVFRYDPEEDVTQFQNMNLQLVNNVALPEMNTTQRQFYLNGIVLPIDKEFKNFAGLINMTCNPHFNVVRVGGFTPGQSPALEVIEANDYCSEPSATPSTVPIPATTLLSPLLTTLASTGTSLASISVVSTRSITAWPSSTINSLATVSPSPSPSPSPSLSPSYAGSHGEADYNALISSVTVAGAVVGLVAWELSWIVAYRHSSGGFQRFANAMALFVPYCLHHMVRRPVEMRGPVD